MNTYIGHPQQLYGVEERRVVGGKGDGMRLLEVRSGNGLQLTVSADRCADISRLSYRAVNLGYFAPCGYVSPKYYDNAGIGFLKSFTAGFLTTCGLTAVGNPCTDAGEALGLHGSISNTPAENITYNSDYEKDGAVKIKAVVRDASLFGQQLVLTREYECPLGEDAVYITDAVQNIGSRTTPYMILYHFNMGYPLLSENAKVYIPNDGVIPRNEHAAKYAADALKMEKPQAGFEEQCYYYKVKNANGRAKAAIYNDDIKTGVVIEYGAAELDYFTEWKMMGEYEYVLGLEPANCTPDGRDVLRRRGKLRFIEPGQEIENKIKISVIKSAPAGM